MYVCAPQDTTQYNVMLACALLGHYTASLRSTSDHPSPPFWKTYKLEYLSTESAALTTTLSIRPITFHPRKPMGVVNQRLLVFDNDLMEEDRELAAVLQHGALCGSDDMIAEVQATYPSHG